MMKSSSFESPKPYLFAHNLKNSISALLRYVIMAQSNSILYHTEANGCIFFWLVALVCTWGKIEIEIFCWMWQNYKVRRNIYNCFHVNTLFWIGNEIWHVPFSGNSNNHEDGGGKRDRFQRVKDVWEKSTPPDRDLQHGPDDGRVHHVEDYEHAVNDSQCH